MSEISPSGWVQTILMEVADWGSGGTPSRSITTYFGGAVPWIKTGELGDKYITSAEEYITREAITNSSAKVFPKGSVGIAMYGATIGKTSILGIDAATNQACAVAQPRTGLIDGVFLYYFLLSQKQAFIDRGKGGAQPNISQTLLKNWPIRLPPLNEQRRIVAKIEELFSELDAGVAALEAARAQLTRYRQALLKAAFEGRLTEAWRQAHAGELESADALLARISAEREARWQRELAEWEQAVPAWEAAGKPGKKPKKPRKPKELPPLTDEERAGLPEVPEGWAWVRVGNIGEVRLGRQRSPKNHMGPNMRPYLRAANVTWDGADLSDVKQMNFSPEELQVYRLRKGDILLAEASGSASEVGKPIVWQGQIPNCCFQNTLIQVRLMGSLFPDYLTRCSLKSWDKSQMKSERCLLRPRSPADTALDALRLAEMTLLDSHSVQRDLVLSNFA